MTKIEEMLLSFPKHNGSGKIAFQSNEPEIGEDEDEKHYLYTYPFSTKIQELAKHELREDLSTVEISLEQFRDWIKNNPDIKNVQTDPSFLLRFLRVKKFSMLMAQQSLLKYLNLKKRYSNLFCNLDYLEPKVLELIDNGYIFVSPNRDLNGRRVVIVIGNRLDPNSISYEHHSRAHMILMETLLMEEENQVLGLSYFADTKGVSTSHITMWPPTDFATVVKWGEQSIPIRHKEVHLINVPSAFKYIYNFFLSRLSPKMKSRIKIHSNMEDIQKSMGSNCLPKEYGGIIPMSDMIESWKKELAAKRSQLLDLDKMEILNSNAIITRRNSKLNQTKSDIMPGSFRKLECD